MNKKIIIGVIVALIVGLVVGYMVHPSAVAQQVKGITNTSGISAATLSVGSGCDNGFTTCTGTTVNQLNIGFCYIQTYSATIAASSTASVDCQGTAATGGLTTVNDTALTGVRVLPRRATNLVRLAGTAS